MKLYCATGNPGKIREFALADPAIEIEPLANFASLPWVEETGATFEENAILKAVGYGVFADGLLFAEDSGLEVDALGGAPGVYSARFAGPSANDSENNALLIERLRGSENRAARYVCVIALAADGKLVETFRGEVEGRILESPRGHGGFGYDPYFFYPPFGCTFAEVPAERKFDVSHRGEALRKLAAYLSRLS
ncbi:MAG: RdgB/HAM1 family non-canonical purine NTP pyrophosphatase [Bryobacterales bacterium]|nr:RdgB/HAM1 family non-canonical purine NTP pyrophosphatase [Bryobacterales bacterium]